MVNDKLDYQKGRDDEDKKECPPPGKYVGSQKDAGQQAVNYRIGYLFIRLPIPLPEPLKRQAVFVL